VLAILRPVVYVYSVLKYGRRSYKPIQISFMFDICQLVISAIRLWRSAKAEQKEGKGKSGMLSQIEAFEIKRRCQISALKYLVRDPVFTDYTMPILIKLLNRMHVPTVVSTYLLAYIKYFRYYAFIS